jgi:hypothetical protein
VDHRNVALLRQAYQDLDFLASCLDDGVVLHPAERSLGAQRLVGKTAVLEYLHATFDSPGVTVSMDVAQIIADDTFGAVTGVLRAALGDATIAMPFCGLWRFAAGRIVEHWENAYEPAKLAAFFAG